MKKAFLSLVCFFVVGFAKAQYVTIPDPIFAAFLQQEYSGCMNGNLLDTTCAAQASVTFVNCQSRNIVDLEGVQYLKKANYLYCGYNSINHIPSLPSSLKILNVSSNALSSLPSLPDSITELQFDDNQLTTLPALPSQLTILDCTRNALTVLPSLPPLLQTLSCGGNSISSLPVLPPSLTSLNCGSNQLTQLPSLPNTLRNLTCEKNLLTSIPALPAGLRTLNCEENLLTALPNLPDSIRWITCSKNQLSTLPALPDSLEDLKCDHNLLTSLPALPSPLNYLSCGFNQLTSLPALPVSLYRLYCYFNQLTSLPALPDTLDNLSCQNNLLTSLPLLPDRISYLEFDNNQVTSVQRFPKSLFALTCSHNQLTSLPPLPDFLYWFDVSNNPNLMCMPLLKEFHTAGPNPIFSIEGTGIKCFSAPIYYSRGPFNWMFLQIDTVPICGIYNPGGCDVSWNILGNVYKDENEDCEHQYSEPEVAHLKINLYQSGTLVQSGYFKSGLYSFDTDIGTYIVAPDTTGLPFTFTCPATGDTTVEILPWDTLRYGVDFGLKCKPGFDIGAWSVVGNIFRPANNVQVNIEAGDLSNAYGAHCASGTSGILSVSITGPAIYVSPAPGALIPNNVGANIITYNIADFGVVDPDKDFNIIIRPDTLAQNGQQICITVSVTPTSGDNNPSNNLLTQCFEVRTSYDPNDKAVSPVTGVGDGWLTYTVNFQNTGNDTAIHIYVEDTLDANLDVASFQLLAYSHPNVTQVLPGDIVRFNFPNIYLPDSNINEPLSHGYVQYKVKMKDNLPVGTPVENTAHIYFDFNAPVATNTTFNRFCIPDTTDLTATICPHEAYLFNDTLRTNTGKYQVILLSSVGCDSVVNLDLTVRPGIPVTEIDDTICSGESYLFVDTLLKNGGDYSKTLSSVNGCDSVVELHLVELPVYSIDIAQSICAGETFFVGTIAHASTGLYHDTLQSMNGCDSIVHLDLTVRATIPSTMIADTICAGGSYLFVDTLIKDEGDYIKTLSSVNGCDSIIQLHLEVAEPVITNLSEVVCFGESILFNDTLRTASGTYTAVYRNDCDSTVVLDLTVSPKVSTNVSVSICSGSSYLFNGVLLDATGDYADTLQTTTGCDSIIELHLEVGDVIVTNLTEVVCFGEGFLFNDTLRTSSGNYTATYQGVCDSVVTLALTVLPEASGSINATICSGTSYFFKGQNLSTPGIYRDTIPNGSGCDSIITLSLDVLPPLTASITASICEDESYYFDGLYLTLSGTYQDTIQNAAGCDSITTLSLTVDSNEVSIQALAGDTLLATGSGTIEWMDCVSGQMVSSQVPNLFISQAFGMYAAIFTHGACVDTTDCIEVGFTSIPQSETPSISIYPNPANDRLIIQPFHFEPKELVAYDVNGRMVLSEKFVNSLNVHMLPAGSYYLEVRESGVILRKRFVKM